MQESSLWSLITLFSLRSSACRAIFSFDIKTNRVEYGRLILMQCCPPLFNLMFCHFFTKILAFSFSVFSSRSFFSNLVDLVSKWNTIFWNISYKHLILWLPSDWRIKCKCPCRNLIFGNVLGTEYPSLHIAILVSAYLVCALIQITRIKKGAEVQRKMLCNSMLNCMSMKY